MSVTTSMRHRKANRCRVCGGGEGDARGKGRRCYGWTAADGSYCHCTREDHAGALDVGPDGAYAHRLQGSCRCGAAHGTEVVVRDEIEATYPYTDESGALLFEVVRKTGKRFLQRRPNGNGGWSWKLGDVRRVLYRLPEIVKDDGRPVHIVEGEKDAHALVSRGHLATCNPGGAGKWHYVAEDAARVLAGRDVVVVADADDVGRRHAAQVVESLQGHARSIRVGEPPPPFKDVSDLLLGGGKVDDLVPLCGEADAPEEPRVFQAIDVDAIFAPRPPIPWLCHGLKLAPGRPALVCGYGYSGKTIVAQALALAVASGTRLFGLYQCRRGRVLHVDYEQGERMTAERYQRLARAQGLTPDDLRGHLELVTFPSLTLDRPEAEQELRRAAEGYALVVIDSFTCAVPGIEENSREIAGPLYALARISEKTGATFVVIHHARKPSKDAPGGAAMAIRGSSAIFGAVDSAYVFSGEKGEPVQVEHVRSPTDGITVPSFALAIEDVEIDGDRRAGLRVRHIDAEERASSQAPWVSLVPKVVDAVRQWPGLPVSELKNRITGKGAAIGSAIAEAERQGVIVNRESKKNRTAYHLADGNDSHGSQTIPTPRESTQEGGTRTIPRFPSLREGIGNRSDPAAEKPGDPRPGTIPEEGTADGAREPLPGDLTAAWAQ